MKKSNVKLVRKVTLIGAIINIALAMLKITIGKLSFSHALVADGVHSFSDLVTDAAILIGSKYWSAPADDCHPYGHGRFETLTNLFIGALLIAVGLGIGIKALLSMDEPPVIPSMLALVAAISSIVVKEALYQWTLIQSRKINSRALHANAWHHRSDALSSVPVVAAVLASYLFPQLLFLDQIAAVLVTVMILKAAGEIIWPSLCEIAEASGDRNLNQQLIEHIKSVPDFKEIHKIRNRRVGSGIYLDFHLLVDPTLNIKQAHDLADAYKNRLMSDFEQLNDVVIHIEPFDEEQSLLPKT